jgi:DNA methyltransferase 1-associated protein 1
MRKKYILSLENRTPDQIAEEEALYVEVKRLEHTERKFKKDRENLLRTLAGIDSGLPDIVEDDGSVLGLNSESTSNIGSNKKKSQRKSGLAMDGDSPATPSVASTPIMKRPQNLKNAAYGKASCVFKVLFFKLFSQMPNISLFAQMFHLQESQRKLLINPHISVHSKSQS